MNPRFFGQIRECNVNSFYLHQNFVVSLVIKNIYDNSWIPFRKIRAKICHIFKKWPWNRHILLLWLSNHRKKIVEYFKAKNANSDMFLKTILGQNAFRWDEIYFFFKEYLHVLFSKKKSKKIYHNSDFPRTF